MKKLILLCTIFFTTLSWGQTLSSRSVNELLNQIENESFTYKGRGKLFSYISTQSCLYVSENVAIFKNYCFPEGKFPARSFTIISKKFGMIDIYEEELPTDLKFKRDISLSEFPEILLPYLSTPFPEASVSGLDAMMEKIHFQYNPGCWSTNFSFYTESKDANCNINTGAVTGFEEWALETQKIVSDEIVWNNLFKRIQSKLK